VNVGKVKVDKGDSNKMLAMPADIKEFLLAYPAIGTSIMLGQRETDRIHRVIESEIAKQRWFKSGEFKTDVNWRIVQVWKRKWRSPGTPGCPWIHFEYGLNWDGCYVETCFDIERDGCPPPHWETLGKLLAKKVAEHPQPWLKGGGWIIDERLRGQRSLIVRSDYCDASNLSAQWLVTGCILHFNQLATLIPFVDEAIRELFGGTTTRG
jgi:hypothetical protein